MLPRVFWLAGLAACAGGGDVTAIPLIGTGGGLAYTARVTIGGQPFAMQVDTGSTTLAVAGMDCTSCDGVSPTYDASAATDQGDTATTTYADNSMWTGDIFSDRVQLVGGPDAVSLDLVSITEQDSFFLDNSNQGILGLGPVDLAAPGTTSFLGQSMSAGVEPVIAFQLCRDLGQMWIGGFDESFMASPPQYSPMLAMDMADPFYSVTIDDLGLAGTSLGFTAADIGPALPDTGTDVLIVPQEINDALTTAIEESPGFAAVFGTQTFAGGCLTPTSGASAAQVDAMLPPLTLSLPGQDGGSFTLTLAPLKSYLLASGSGYCLAIASVADFDATILGDTILRAFVTVIDLPGNRVGFAPQVGCH